MPKIVKCPHCGANNPFSLLVTVCQRCKGDISGAEPVERTEADEAARVAPTGVGPAAQQPPAAQVISDKGTRVVPTEGLPTPDSLATTEARVAPAQALPSPEPAPEAPAAHPGRVPVAETPGPTTVPTQHRVEVPITEVGSPPIAPSRSAEAGRPPARHPDGRAICGRCGYTNQADAAICARCQSRLEDEWPVVTTSFRSCARCGHRQNARRNSCEKCGMHFVGSDSQASTVLSGQPLSRAPRGTAEAATTALAVTVGCLIPFVVGLVFALLLWLGEK